MRAVALVELKKKNQKYHICDFRVAGGKEQIQNANNIKHRNTVNLASVQYKQCKQRFAV